MDGRLEMRDIIWSSVQRKELGQEEGEIGGMGESGGAAELKHEEKKELRQSALSESDARVETLAESNGIEEDVQCRDFTYDQNLDGGA